MGFEVGVADEVVKGEWLWADDVAKVCVHHASCCASFKPPRNQCNHGVNLAAVAGKTANEVGTFFCLKAVACDESRNGLIVECRDKDFDVFRMCGGVALGEVEKCLMERFRNLRCRQHVRHFIDRAEAKFEIGMFLC